MKVASVDVGFIELPEQIMLNIYAVGCKKNCKDCHNPDLRNFNYKKSYELTDEVFETKLKLCSGLIDGVCWLGGDAVYQEDRLINLSNLIKKHGNLVNCLFTGLKLQEVSNNIKEVMDVIVDGEWNGKKLDEKDTSQTIWVKSKDNWMKTTYEEFKTVKKA